MLLKTKGIFTLLQAQDLDRVFLKVRALAVRKNNERGLVSPALNKMKNSSFY